MIANFVKKIHLLKKSRHSNFLSLLPDEIWSTKGEDDQKEPLNIKLFTRPSRILLCCYALPYRRLFSHTVYEFLHFTNSISTPQKKESQ